MIDYVSLRSELIDDPQSIGYASMIADGADGDIADVLNTPMYPVIGKLPIDSLQAWMMAESVQDGSGRSIWQAMQDAAGIPGEHQRAAQEAISLIESRLSTVDLSLPRPAALLALYAASGMISSAQRAAIISMATAIKSRAEILLGASVSHTDIANALRGSNAGH